MDVLSNVGYGTIVALVLAESAGVPVPGGTSLAAGGILAETGDLDLGVVLTLGFGAATLGAIAGYAFGWRFGDGLLTRPGRFASHRARIRIEGRAAFIRYGSLVVATCRFFPVLREAVPVSAGAFRMNFASFIVFTAAGAALWTAAYTLLGFYAGAKAGPILGSLILVMLKILGAVLVAALVYVKRRRASAQGRS
jgi:membrane protein DedA with SNARE-associated domain